jgi:hypothetical protein
MLEIELFQQYSYFVFVLNVHVLKKILDSDWTLFNHREQQILEDHFQCKIFLFNITKKKKLYRIDLQNMVRKEWSCYPPKRQEIRRASLLMINSSPNISTESATVTKKQVTSTSSNLQAGSSMSNRASTRKQETSSDGLEEFLVVPCNTPIPQITQIKIHLNKELKPNSLPSLIPVAISNPPIAAPASAAVPQNHQATFTSSNLQAGSSMSNRASTRMQETSSDDKSTL